MNCNMKYSLSKILFEVLQINVTFLHLLHRVFNVTTKKWELKYSVDNADTLFTINLSQE